MRDSKKIFLLSCLSLLALWACKKKYDTDIVGPDMKFATSNFQILEPLSANYFNGKKFAKDTVSFGRDTIVKILINPATDTTTARVTFQKPFNTFFKAKFNESVKWTISIKGDSSKAEKILSDVGSFLDSTVTGVLWNGNSNSFKYFSENETAVATLSILGSDVTQTIRFRIAKTTAYDATQAILLNDFEGSYGQTVYNDKLDMFPSPMPKITSSFNPPQGTHCLVVTGADNNGDYFVGGYQQKFEPDIFKNYEASDIYFNMYIYGFGKDAGLTPNATKLNIGVSEDDKNPNGSFEADIEDSFEKQVNVDWQGWKLIAVRYSELKRSISLENGGSGNNIIQPDRAYSLNANLISSPNGSRVGAAIDYVTITFGKPLEK